MPAASLVEEAGYDFDGGVERRRTASVRLGAALSGGLE
jgi:hypothetical protein